MAVLQAVERFGTPHNSWLIGMLERKPRMRVATALANKMARGLWAMVTKQEDYRPPPRQRRHERNAPYIVSKDLSV
jgi:transposase